MKNIVIVVLSLVSVCATQTVFGQRKPKRIKSQIEMYPLENSITLEFTRKAKDGTIETYTESLFAILAGKESGSRRGEYLLFKDRDLLERVQSLTKGTFEFESDRMSGRSKRKLLKNASDNPTEEPLLIELRRSRTLRVFNITRLQ